MSIRAAELLMHFLNARYESAGATLVLMLATTLLYDEQIPRQDVVQTATQY